MTDNEQKIQKYLTDHNTLVLSTYGDEGPWATPVFYVSRGWNLYFLSERTSKHSQNLILNTLVAVTITEDYRDWRKIQGIQLKGKAHLIDSLKETAIVLTLYLKKFPEVRKILETPASFKGVSKVQWHCIKPEYIKFTDNSSKFGEHFELKLNT